MDRIAGLLEAFHAQYPEVKLHTYSGDADAASWSGSTRASPTWGSSWARCGRRSMST